MSEVAQSPVDTGRLWVGGLMAGVVAAGVAVVGLLVVRGILDIPPLGTAGEDLLAAGATARYAGLAALAGLAATALLHGLLVAAPQPFQFFGWIVGLAVAIAVLLPFTTDSATSSKVSVAAINLAVGMCVGSIVGGVGRSATAAHLGPAGGRRS